MCLRYSHYFSAVPIWVWTHIYPGQRNWNRWDQPQKKSYKISSKSYCSCFRSCLLEISNDFEPFTMIVILSPDQWKGSAPKGFGFQMSEHLDRFRSSGTRQLRWVALISEMDKSPTFRPHNDFHNPLGSAVANLPNPRKMNVGSLSTYIVLFLYVICTIFFFFCW